MPRVPGFTGSGGQSLAGQWPKPALEFPAELWPTAELARVREHPTEWVVIEEHYFRDEAHGGVGCVLIDQAGIAQVLADDNWIGRDIGRTSIVTSWSSGPDEEAFEDGLTGTDRDVAVQFFAQVREHHGLVLPSVEITLPFLWYWDAHQDGDNWVYLNEPGRDQDLIRTTVHEDAWRVEVRAFELRQYLAVQNMALVVQHDVVLKSEHQDFERADDEFRSDWCYFTWHAVADMPLLGSRPGFSRLLGQYVIKPLRGARAPAWQARRQKDDYPQFQHDVDPQTGQAIRHTCDPDQLGTYYDPPDTPPRPHYLTPVYFNREVLGRYTSEPSRYTVTATRLSCLNLWGVAISTNTAGLIEVYLGDLGRDLPADEWAHWLGHNVAPAGSMAEDRFRRDFLNQPTASHDPIGDLRRARAETQELARGLLGSGLWKDLQGRQRREFDNLHSPTSRDPSALDSALLTLTKGLIDAIESAGLKAYLGKDVPPGNRTLEMLEALVERLGGDRAVVGPFRDVQRLRSAGGVAHLAGSDVDKVLAKTGIAGLSPHEAFESLCGRLTEAIQQLGALLAAPRQPQIDQGV